MTRLQRAPPLESCLAGRGQDPKLLLAHHILCRREPHPRQRQGAPLPHAARAQALPPVSACPANVRTPAYMRHDLASVRDARRNEALPLVPWDVRPTPYAWA